MTGTAGGVLLVVELTICGLAVMLRGTARVASAFRCLDRLLVDAAAPEPDDLPGPPARGWHASEIEAEVLTIRFVDDQQRCKQDGCPSCRLVTDTAGRLP